MTAEPLLNRTLSIFTAVLDYRYKSGLNSGVPARLGDPTEWFCRSPKNPVPGRVPALNSLGTGRVKHVSETGNVRRLNDMPLSGQNYTK